MRTPLPDNSSTFANWLIGLVLVLVPFHAFLTVFASSLIGHYTLLRLWDDVLLLVLIGAGCFWLARSRSLRTWFAGSLLVRLIFAYGALTILLGFVSWVKGDVSPKALAYGVLVNVRFFAWFLAVLLAAQRSVWLRRSWPKLVLIPAAIVTVFAVLQFTVLPHDFLSHFGYRAATTIAPIETINHNSHYIRVQSTLRGANPLGAYLVIILSAVGVLFVRGRKKLLGGILGLVALLALFASGSRSAWIGALLGLAVVAWRQLKTRRQQMIFGVISLLILAAAASGYLLLRSNPSLQNAVLHTQDHSAVSTSSNSAHASALRSGVKDVLHQPLGDGPGTAGPASEYNGSHPARIAENYYVQVAQETGWLGLALFLGIVVLVAMELYQLLGTSRLALVLFASLIGLSFVNLLSHAWTDDTLAFLWWGLAGIALGRPAQKFRKP
jgi:O-antigen ligase